MQRYLKSEYNYETHFIFFILITDKYFSLANDRFAVADIFTDHMVLQRNANVKVWGEGTDGSLVEVRFEGQNRKMVVVKGKWMVELKTGEAGGPYKLEIVMVIIRFVSRMFS